MDAAVMHTQGQPPRFQQFPDPEPQDDELLVKVAAAALPRHLRIAVDNPLYGGGRSVPYVCGLEGLGYLDDGSRVVFYYPREPYGTLAQLSVTRRERCVPVPGELDDATAAALLNPGVTTCFSLSWVGKLVEGESVLILGATGFAGKLAIQAAKKMFGAGRVVAAGRNPEILESLPELGADATIQLDQPDDKLSASFLEQMGDGYDVILDFLWGHPAEVLLGSIPRTFIPRGSIRYVQLGSSAGEQVSGLHADTLRRGGVSILNASAMGTVAETVESMNDFQKQLMQRTAAGELRVDVDRVPLADIEKSWHSDTPGRRMVIIP
ncbi:zinc-binding alcohol dehydrogenase family protein [Micromonospora sp. Llam7]|uniref:quinone oxidoreductase family protein n=1 Tax=Micromonospora tarapacensis TaxID=2835305 RepID=UPI001C8301FD|nr:zinc-binding alcohol dehydrogenase family protein [Micromonospora tarapacensis]MBX7268168.1 zinc-binding alcohol dehydrogenase family protein [Micromonospora tarapacensis]